MDSVQEAHEEHLRVALATVARAVAFSGFADLDDDLIASRCVRQLRVKDNLPVKEMTLTM